MIVFPNALVLSPPDSVPLWKPRIGYQTFGRGRTAFNVTVSSEDASGPRDAPLREDTAEFWMPTALPATWELDLGASQSIDYIGVVGTIGSSAGSLAVSVSPDLVTAYSTFGGSGVTPADDAPIVYVDTLTSVRRVKLAVTGGATMPRIAVVYAGKLLSMDRGLALGFSPPTMSRQTTLMQSLGRSGQFLGQSYRRMGVHATPKFDQLSETWYRSYFEPFSKSARLYPYFFVWNAQAWPLEVAYAWAPEDIAPTYSGHNWLSVSWQMFGIGNA